MATIRKLKAVLSADISAFDDGMKKAGDGLVRFASRARTELSGAENNVRSFSSTAGGSLSSTVEAFGGATSAVGLMTAAIGGISVAKLLELGKVAIDTRADMEALEKGLAAVTKDTGSLTDQMARLKNVAKLPGLGFEEAVKGSVRLQAAGFSAQEAERYLKSFGNAIASVGGGKAELDGVTLALAQMAAKANVSAEEINQLAERLPQIREAMKEAFGTADTELMQKAGLAPKAAIDALSKVLEKAKEVDGGLKNAKENISDAFKAMFNEIGRSGQPVVEGVLNPLADWLERATKGVKAVNDIRDSATVVRNAALGRPLGKVDPKTARTAIQAEADRLSSQLAPLRGIRDDDPRMSAGIVEYRRQLENLQAALRGRDMQSQMTGVSLKLSEAAALARVVL